MLYYAHGGIHVRIVIVRQRPGIGDCLLLAPLIREIKFRHPACKLTVLTDSSYMGGALPKVFEGIPGVDRVECINSLEWTTDSNKAIEPLLGAASSDPPYSVQKADIVYDCNGAFMQFERQNRGNTPCGIAEFWLRYHQYYTTDVCMLPKYTPPQSQKNAVSDWLEERPAHKGKKLIGIVLRSGAACRDWDYNDKCTSLADWMYTSGHYPIGIDPWHHLPSSYGSSCIGKQVDFVGALLERCDVALTPDTGLLHMAQAVGTPTVAMWGIVPPELRTKGYNTVVVPNTSLGQCNGTDVLHCPCCTWTFQQWSCMTKITLPMLTTALTEVLTRG